MTRRKQSTIYIPDNRMWFEEECLIVEKMAGAYSSTDITRCVNQLRAKYHLPMRSKSAVQRRAAKHGISLEAAGLYSTFAVTRIFGVSPETVGLWRDAGWLCGRPWGKQIWVCTDDDITNLINRRPWLFTLEVMPPGKFRNLLEVLTRRDPWIDLPRMAALLNTSKSTLRKYVRLGYISYEQKLARHNGTHMLRASQIDYIREVLEQGSKHELPKKSVDLEVAA